MHVQVPLNFYVSYVRCEAINLVIVKTIPFFTMPIIFLAIHCVWDKWVEGNCSTECGTGTKTNTRVKLVEESNGGTCTGNSEETLECKEKECPGL